MHLLSIGLNHASAPLAVREQAAVVADHLEDALADVAQREHIAEATILSTCNRTELYCRVPAEGIQLASDWLCDFHQLDRAEVAPYLYALPDQKAVRHAFRVAAGLDSMVLGEPQILGQMKTAFAKAHRNGNTGKVLNRLFQTTFSVAKEIRSNTAIGNHAVSVASAAVTLARQIFSDFSQQTVLLVGAGETVQLVCRHLHAQGVRKIIIANRSVERAQAMVSEFGAQAISLDELSTRLPDADIVVSSTASTLPILGKGVFESALKARRNRAMLVVDLAVPRDVEQEVGDLSNVYLYTVDDLHQVVSENLQSRQKAALAAEKIVELQTEQFMRWFHNLQAVPTLTELRDQTTAITETELANAQRRLQSGEQPELVLQQFARTLSRKFMHAPTESLRQNHNDDFLAATRELFGLAASDDPDQDK